MRPATFWTLFIVLVGLGCGFASAQVRYNVLYTFGTNGGTNDGWQPNGPLIVDGAGNMYGTTFFGGGNTSALCPDGCGTVFEISPAAGGGWTETVLHAFADGQDGLHPLSSLVFDAEGNLYGTTAGSLTECQAPNCGTVFELSPSPDSFWTETVLYSFAGPPDGAAPLDSLVFDADGNLYGTTVNGGADGGYGTVFELSPSSLPRGNWTESILYSFCQVGGVQECSDGAYPSAGVVLDSSGNLYGTTTNGGRAKFWGVAYELSPNFGGAWTETVLYEFEVKTGGAPEAGLSFDPEGNLYGTVFSGGLSGPHCSEENYPPYSIACGGAFRLTPKAGGGWSEGSFLFSGQDGGNPSSGLVVNGSSVYGTTLKGGGGYGTVFRITGKNEAALYSFCSRSNCEDGSSPDGITLDGDKLYGVAQLGGAYSQGVVFSIAP